MAQKYSSLKKEGRIYSVWKIIMSQIVGQGTIQFDRLVPLYWQTLLLPSSGWKAGCNQLYLQGFGTHLPNFMVVHCRRLNLDTELLQETQVSQPHYSSENSASDNLLLVNHYHSQQLRNVSCSRWKGQKVDPYLFWAVYVRQNFVLSDCDVMMEQDYFRVNKPSLAS